MPQRSYQVQVVDRNGVPIPGAVVELIVETEQCGEIQPETGAGFNNVEVSTGTQTVTFIATAQGKRREFQWAVSSWSVTLRFGDIEIPRAIPGESEKGPPQKWVPAVVFTAVSFLFIAAAFFITGKLTNDQRIILNYIFAFCTGMSLYFMGGSAMARYRWHGPKVQFTFIALAGAAMFALVYLNPLFAPEPVSQPQLPGQSAMPAPNSAPTIKKPPAPPTPKGLQWVDWSSARRSIPRSAIAADPAKRVYLCRVSDPQLGSLIGRTQGTQCLYRISNGERSQERYEVPAGTGLWANRGWPQSLKIGYAIDGATTYACRVRLDNDDWHGWLPGTAYDAGTTPDRAQQCLISVNGKDQAYRTFELFYLDPAPAP
jgi:hypothetical protein